MAALLAASKTSLTPNLFNAEHSKYAEARICFAKLRPSSYVTHSLLSLRKSTLLATRMKGTEGQKCLISGTQMRETFSSDACESTANAIRTTSKYYYVTTFGAFSFDAKTSSPARCGTDEFASTTNNLQIY
jgi:hypothetical protein